VIAVRMTVNTIPTGPGGCTFAVPVALFILNVPFVAPVGCCTPILYPVMAFVRSCTITSDKVPVPEYLPPVVRRTWAWIWPASLLVATVLTLVGLIAAVVVVSSITRAPVADSADGFPHFVLRERSALRGFGVYR
jgi:hypothetical protein